MKSYQGDEAKKISCAFYPLHEWSSATHFHALFSSQYLSVLPIRKTGVEEESKHHDLFIEDGIFFPPTLDASTWVHDVASSLPLTVSADERAIKILPERALIFRSEIAPQVFASF